jgi:hypothetical protein
MYIGASSGSNFFAIRDRKQANTVRLYIDTSGNVGIGTTTNLNQTLNVNGSINSTSLYQNGTLINFNSYATNTNLSTNYSTTGNDPNYLLKTGGAMTGQITGVTTISGSTGLFGTVATTNNTNVGVPSLGAGPGF